MKDADPWTAAGVVDFELAPEWKEKEGGKEETKERGGVKEEKEGGRQGRGRGDGKHQQSLQKEQ